jgi:MoaA/NifB/PqqE/SkfB family radical SAM enzyme
MITIDELQENLKAKFNLICFLDLADMRSRHRNIFDIFEQYHRKEYQPHDRLVFYTSHEPEQQLLDHIQHAASQIDISNFFILFVCPVDIKNKLIISNSKHGFDKTVMQNLTVDLVDTLPFAPGHFSDRSFLCPLPFMSASISLQKNVKPCCKYQGSCGNIKNQSLSDIFYDQPFQTLREQMLRGEKPVGCSTCVREESHGSTSNREIFLLKYQKMLDREFIDQPKIVDLTIHPSSLCNIKCRICHPDNSSTIRNEEIQFAKDKAAMKNRLPIVDGNDVVFVFSDPEITPKFMHILGGEPFLWPMLPSVIDQLVSTGRSKYISIEFNTNGTLYPAYFEKIIENFKHVEVLISVDAVAERFELQRGSTWSQVLENIKRFCESSNITVKLAVTINIQNLLYLDDLVELAEDLGIEIIWNCLETPSQLSIDYVTEAVKHKAKSLYENHRVAELRNLAQRMTLSPAVSGKAFLDYMKLFDLRRNQDFFQFHREIVELMSS